MSTVNVSKGVAVGSSSANKRIVLYVVPTIVTTELAPSLHSAVPVNVSALPASLKLPLTVTDWPSSIDAESRFNASITGATLPTVTVSVSDDTPPSSSVTVSVTV